MNVKTMITSFTKKSWLGVIFFVSLLSFFGVGIQGVAACTTVYAGSSSLCLDYSLDKAVYLPGETMTASVQISPVAIVGIPTVLYVEVAPTNAGPGTYIVNTNNPNLDFNVVRQGTITAPAGIGPQTAYFAFFLQTSSGSGSAILTTSYTVQAASVGNINVSSNIAGASYTITGPAILSGSGVSNSHANQPTGGYTITWNDVAGYTKPGSSSQTLSSGGTISFVGNYSGVAPTCSYTGPINWVEPTGLECSVGVSYNSVPVGGQRTAIDSNASGNGYTGSYTAQCDGSGNWQYVSHVCNAPAATINVNF
jgi:hypothetical protein